MDVFLSIVVLVTEVFRKYKVQYFPLEPLHLQVVVVVLPLPVVLEL